MNKRSSFIPGPFGLPAPAKLTQPKSPNFTKPRLRQSVVNKQEKQLHKPPGVATKRISTRSSISVAPVVKPPRPPHGKPPTERSGRPAAGRLSFGFLRPTKSSMAKQTSLSSLSLEKLEILKEDEEADTGSNQTRQVESSFAGLEKRQKSVEKGHSDNVPESPKPTSRNHLPSTPPSSDKHESIFQSGDRISKNPFLFGGSSPLKFSERRQTIIPTPKFPRSRCIEKHAKRKISFIPLSRHNLSKEMLRCTISPPPDFDVTINSACSSPAYISKPSNYDCFSTPIMNLAAALSFTEDEDESVYYTPCAEV